MTKQIDSRIFTENCEIMYYDMFTFESCRIPKYAKKAKVHYVETWNQNGLPEAVYIVEHSFNRERITKVPAKDIVSYIFDQEVLKKYGMV